MRQFEDAAGAASSFLKRLQAVPGEVYDAATLDGNLGSKSIGTVVEATVPQESSAGLHWRFVMRYFKVLALALAIVLPAALLAPAANAQVSFGIGVGPYYGAYDGYAYGPPVCTYGYYAYYPYACAPYGYYGPEWFSGGIFIGAGPWYRGGYYRGGYGYGHYFPRGYSYAGRGGYVGRGYVGGNRGYIGGGSRGYVGGGARGFSGGGARGGFSGGGRGGFSGGGHFSGGGGHGGGGRR